MIAWLLRRRGEESSGIVCNRCGSRHRDILGIGISQKGRTMRLGEAATCLRWSLFYTLTLVLPKVLPGCDITDSRNRTGLPRNEGTPDVERGTLLRAFIIRQRCRTDDCPQRVDAALTACRLCQHQPVKAISQYPSSLPRWATLTFPA
jgi:hypothetical protein